MSLDHLEAQELLSAYADGELGADSRGELEAHLSTCARCRAALSVQRQVHARFAADRPPQAEGSLRDRIRGRLGDASSQRDAGLRRRAAVAWGGWAVAAALAAVLVYGALPRAADSRPPMVVAALADYRDHATHELPAPVALAALQASVPFASAPRLAGGARLLGAWGTTLRGEPAAVFAYRVGDRVVLAYVVSESMFFRQPSVRETVASQGRYVTSEGAQSVVAFPTKNAGVLIVGDVPASELELLRT